MHLFGLFVRIKASLKFSNSTDRLLPHWVLPLFSVKVVEREPRPHIFSSPFTLAFLQRKCLASRFTPPLFPKPHLNIQPPWHSPFFMRHSLQPLLLHGCTSTFRDTFGSHQNWAGSTVPIRLLLICTAVLTVSILYQSGIVIYNQ